ncbi:RagB/SusD family nutrient uptake outer membrane protein [Dysgonomonas sp. Marseille-P4677]|uniref:RagB/SusD family nutrient uptake outer membrane protein n=1 Tax=Dysgonomonas sp. Marseille-P4677 TaxID=2364790 RepID=UPI0019147199|nr:RagB/SusD family nutrient uptake outer membrane protein [Dysgonomonas sp. Marseille-P4677]MBK5721952.1 RagB/SusD family nutrient uptake outer membrane protein [Dysgonomonas sp. Marseille-P4677]
MKKLFYILFIFLITFSCSLEEEPKSSVSKDEAFATEAGLKAYTYGLYDIFPSKDDAHKKDAMSDYGAVNSFDNFLRDGAYSAETSSGWSWSDLRQVNYFIENCTNTSISESVRNNYLGIARFFRAYFYYEKLVRFGDVPWVDRPLSIDDEALYGSRDSRTLIVEKIIEDLDFAYENIKATKSDGSTLTKWVASAFKSRVCLFEASFRKYHPDLKLTATANDLYREAVKSAEEVINKSGHALYTGNGTNLSYRTLFTSDAVVTSEVMLANVCSKELAILNDANWYWTSGTYGPRFSFIRTFINTFLRLDGTPFTDVNGYMTMEFYDECQNRDMRLSQIIRTPGYKRDGKPAAPNFNGYSYTGYQPIKFSLDPTSYDDGSLNTNAIPLFRYAEVLLNYAEAKAELGELTDSDWEKTIGALRKRAGITGGLTTKPTKVDSYLQAKYFPELSDPVLLEVRRERSIELALEGFRFTDLLRWKKGELMTMVWDGMYVPGLMQAMDLDGDGTEDVIFYQGSKKPEGLPKTCTPVNVDATTRQTLSNGTYGNLIWSKNDPRKWYEDGRQYYYPIPALAIVKNPNLKQNPGWDK